MNKITVTLNGNPAEMEEGLTKVDALYQQLGISCDANWLYLDKEDDIDVPLLPDDYIVLHGGEKIIVGDISSHIGENPSVRKPIRVTFNGRRIKEGLKRAKINSSEICSRDEDLESPKLFADLAGKVDDFIQGGLSLVVQDTDSYLTISAGDDDVIDIEECSKDERKPPKGQKTYKIKIDGELHLVEQQEMTGEQILKLAGKNYEEWSLNQKLHGGRREQIRLEETVDFAQPGIERFETVMKQAQQG